MIDATILIPTFRHAALLPYAVRSALDQDEASVEVFVVGDGVEDDTRAALEPFAADYRLRFSTSRRGRGTASSTATRHSAKRLATSSATSPTTTCCCRGTCRRCGRR